MWWESDAAQWAWRHFCPEPERNQVWSTAPMGMILWKPPHLLVALSADLCHGHLRRQRGHGGVPVPGGAGVLWVEVPRGISQNGGLMTVTIWLIIFSGFSAKIGGILEGNMEDRRIFEWDFADWIWLGSKKWLGLGMGFGRESRRNIKDLRGIWRISEGTLNRISYLMISSDMFMGFLMALKHQKYGFPQQTLGLNCVLPAKKKDSRGFNQEKLRI